MRLITVVVATNTQGKVEVFAFETEGAARRFARQIDGRGETLVALVRTVDLLDDDDASRTGFLLAGLLPIQSPET